MVTALCAAAPRFPNKVSGCEGENVSTQVVSQISIFHDFQGITVASQDVCLCLSPNQMIPSMRGFLQHQVTSSLMAACLEWRSCVFLQCNQCSPSNWSTVTPQSWHEWRPQRGIPRRRHVATWVAASSILRPTADMGKYLKPDTCCCSLVLARAVASRSPSNSVFIGFMLFIGFMWEMSHYFWIWLILGWRTGNALVPHIQTWLKRSIITVDKSSRNKCG